MLRNTHPRLHVQPLVCIPALALLTGLGRAQDAPTRIVTGTVRDTSGIPILFVNVEGPMKVGALGDEEGRFRIVLLNRDASSLTLRRLGFHPVTI